MSEFFCTFAPDLKNKLLLTIKKFTIMKTRYVYLVESFTESSKFGFKVFSSFLAAKKFVAFMPGIKHKITRLELLNMNSF